MREAISREIAKIRALAGQQLQEALNMASEAERSASFLQKPLTEPDQLRALRIVRRTRARAASAMKRIRILMDSLELHVTALSRLDEIEATGLKALSDEDLDALALDYDSALLTHSQTTGISRQAPEEDFDPCEDERQMLERIKREETAEPEAEPEPVPAPEPQVKRPPLMELA